MTKVVEVTAKEMGRRTGLSEALGYALPDKNLILLNKNLKGKARKAVLKHEFDHIKKGEEGPFWGAIAGAVISGIMSKRAADKQADAMRAANEQLTTELPVYAGYGPGGATAGLGLNLPSVDYSFQQLMSQSPQALLQQRLSQAGAQAGQGFYTPAPGTVGTGVNLNFDPVRDSVASVPPGTGGIKPAHGTATTTASTTPQYKLIENPDYTRWQRLQNEPEADPNIPAPPKYIINPSSVNPDTLEAQAIDDGRTPKEPADPLANIFGVDLGQLEPSRYGLTSLAQQAIGRAGAMGGQLPAGVQQAAAGLQGIGLPGMGNLGRFQGMQLPGFAGDPNAGLLQAQLGQVFGQTGATQAQMGQAASPLSRALQQTAGLGALGGLAEASMTGPAARAQQLALLRQEAAPEEARQLQALQENLFATGRGATTGGAQLAEAFARGLGQADVSRQLAAAQEGRATQQQALGRATGLTGLYGQQRGLEESLLQGAFGRFAQTQELLGGLGQTQYQRAFGGSQEQFRRAQEEYNRQLQLEQLGFQRGLGLNELAFGRAQQQLQTQMGLAQFAPQLQALQLAPAITALQAQSGLQTQALEPFQNALALAQAQANARIGAGSNLATLASQANFGAPEQLMANLAATIGERLQSRQQQGGTGITGAFTPTTTAPVAQAPASGGGYGGTSYGQLTQSLGY